MNKIKNKEKKKIQKVDLIKESPVEARFRELAEEARKEFLSKNPKGLTIKKRNIDFLN